MLLSPNPINPKFKQNPLNPNLNQKSGFPPEPLNVTPPKKKLKIIWNPLLMFLIIQQ